MFMNAAETDAQGDREVRPRPGTLLGAHGGSTASVYSVGVYYLLHLHVAFSRDWIGKIPGRRAWQPTLVFLPGESPWTEEPGG